jgi:hypothetical protein
MDTPETVPASELDRKRSRESRRGFAPPLGCRRRAPGLKQQLAAVRMLFGWLVTGEVVPMKSGGSGARTEACGEDRRRRRCSSTLRKWRRMRPPVRQAVRSDEGAGSHRTRSRGLGYDAIRLPTASAIYAITHQILEEGCAGIADQEAGQ